MKKVAIFVDWENIRKGIFEQAAIQPNPIHVNYNDVNNIMKFINAFLDPATEEPYRVFFYLTDPYNKIVKGVDYSKTNAYANATSLIDRLSVCDFIAIRKGTLVMRGFDVNNHPIFQQKKVDMLLGLDIAHVSYCKLVDRVLILSCDTDVVPALKVARINGLQVIHGSCPDVAKPINRELKHHADIIREVTFASIFIKTH